MSFFSQLAVMLLIIGISSVLVRANRDLERAYREGDHFAPEEDREPRPAAGGMKDGSSLTPERDQESGPAAGGMKDGSSLTPERDQESGPVSGREAWPAMVAGGEYKPVLQMLDDNFRVVRSIPVNHLPFDIGRDRTCDLRLSDLCVAKHHCRIREDGGCLILEDNGTRTRMSVDGQTRDRIRLSEGCLVEIGDTMFVVRMDPAG